MISGYDYDYDYIYIYIYIYIYYDTPFPLNLANKQQANKQQATASTSAFCFGHFVSPMLRAPLYSRQTNA